MGGCQEKFKSDRIASRAVYVMSLRIQGNYDVSPLGRCQPFCYSNSLQNPFNPESSLNEPLFLLIFN